MQGHIRSAAREAGSTSPTSACTPPSAASSAAGGSGSSGSPQRDLPQVRRQADRDRRAPPRDQGRLRKPKECQAALNKLLVADRREDLRRADQAHLREYLKSEWLPAIEATIRPSTYRSYKQHVECHICPHLGSMQLQKLSGSQINALYAKLALTGKKDGKSGLTPLTIRHVHATLHRALKDAVRWERLTRNPIEAADPPRISGDRTTRVKTWSAEQLKAFLDSTKDEPLSPLWHLLAMTGLRRGEALGLRWEDVDLEAGSHLRAGGP